MLHLQAIRRTGKRRPSPGAIFSLIALATTTPLAAQQLSGVPAVDSATTARSAWQRAVTALGAHDIATAQREVNHAVTAWPTQEAYAWGRAVIAATAHDTSALLSALSAYADLGLGRDIRAHPLIGPFTTLPEFSRVAARVLANGAPLVRSRVRATIADTTLWPEGVDFDPRTKRFYIANVRHRTIVELSPDGSTRELFARDQPNIGAILGIRVDSARGVLWATTTGLPQMEGYHPADSTIAALLRIRISDGHIQGRWDIPPVTGGHTIGDLAIGPAGDVFLTDSNQPVLYRLRPRGDTLEHMTHPLFHSLQGLAPTPDGETLYLSDYSHGLLRVSLRTNAVTRIADAPNSTSLGCDGILLDRGAIIAIQNGVLVPRLMRFVLDARGDRIVSAEVLDRNTGIADEPTIVTRAGDDLVYVATSQWNKFDDRGVRSGSVPLGPTVLLAVPRPPLR